MKVVINFNFYMLANICEWKFLYLAFKVESCSCSIQQECATDALLCIQRYIAHIARAHHNLIG